MPYRAMTNILAFMLAVDEVVPGFAAPETLLYSPELKFYSNRVKMDERLPHERAGPALPGGLERLDARAHDGIRHGLFGGTFACRRLEQGKRARTPSA